MAIVRAENRKTDLEPFFRTKLGVLYNADCKDILPSLKKVDLVLTDPPYGIGEAAGKNNSRSNKGKVEGRNTKGTRIESTKFEHREWDNAVPSADLLDEILSKASHSIVFGGNYFQFPPSPCWIVWDKLNGANDFADCELAWTNFKTAVRKVEYRWNGMFQGNMSTTSIDKEKRIHPTQKPVPLFVWMLERYAKKEHVVLDPFMGSGTTAIACEQLGMHWIGIERETVYCEAIKKRLQEPIKLRLF